MIPLSLRFYRVLLLAYPAPFRQEFAPEMMSMFRARCVEESAARGWPGLVLIWLKVLIDTLITAPEEHYYMLMNDIRYAFRSLAKSRGFTLTAIGCLALGIGASTAIYSIVNAVLLRPLPYRDSEHFARLYTEFPTQGEKGLSKFWFSPPEFRLMKEQNQAWDQVEGWVTGGASLQGTERPLRINVCYVTGGLMPMLGVAPALGRLIIPPNDDPGVGTVIVLSDRLWRSAFGGDPNVIGREMHLDGGKAIIAGVMPPSFEFPAGAADPSEIWVPLQLPPQMWMQTGSHFLSLVAHLHSRRSASRMSAESVAQAIRSHRRCRRLAQGASHQFEESSAHHLRIPGRSDRQLPARDARADGRGRVLPVDRLRERRQSPAGPFRHAPPRARRAKSHRRG